MGPPDPGGARSGAVCKRIFPRDTAVGYAMENVQSVSNVDISMSNVTCCDLKRRDDYQDCVHAERKSCDARTHRLRARRKEGPGRR